MKAHWRKCPNRASCYVNGTHVETVIGSAKKGIIFDCPTCKGRGRIRVRPKGKK